MASEKNKSLNDNIKSPQISRVSIKASEKSKSMKDNVKKSPQISRFTSRDASCTVEIGNEPKILKDASDQFFNDGIRQIDFILVYDNADKSTKQQRSLFHTSLTDRNLELEFDNSETVDGRKYCFVKIHAPCEVLVRMAESYRLKVPFKEDNHPQPMPKTWFEQQFNIKWFSLPDLYLQKYEVHHNYYATFEADKADLFVPYSENSFFEPRHRIEFVWEILCDTEYFVNKTVYETNPGIERLIKGNVYLAAYPIHDGGQCWKCDPEITQPITNWNVRRLLHRYWSNVRNIVKHQPIVQIERYYGLTVAFYFAWLGCYTRALIPPAIVGVLLFIYGLSSFSTDATVTDVCETNEDLWMCPFCIECMPWKLGESCILYQLTVILANKGTVFYSVFISLWSAWFLIYWGRKQSELKWDWQDTSISSMQDRIRYEYIEKSSKVKVQNPITLKLEPYVDERFLLKRKLYSAVIMFFVILVILFLMAIMITIRVHVTTGINKLGFKKRAGEIEILGRKIKRFDRIIAGIICGILSAVVIIIAERIYVRVAKKLTDSEFPRTIADYERSYIYKRAVFEIFNYFGTLIYLSFFKGSFFYGPVLHKSGQFFSTEYCYPGGCMTELTIEVITRIILVQYVHTAWQYVSPLIRKKVRQKKKFFWKSTNVKRWEKDFALVPPPDLFITEEYEEMVLQYGLVCLFSAAFPLVPMLALLNNLLELRSDATKWTRFYRRPVPQIATDIGPWYQIIAAISLISIAVNGAIVVFTSELIQQYVYVWNYSPSGGYEGYTIHQLSEFNLSTTFFSDDFDPTLFTNTCYFGSYRESTSPFNLTKVGLNMRMYKWMVFAVFLMVVSFSRGMITTFSRKIPKTLDIQMRREQYLARQLFFEHNSNKRAEKARQLSRSRRE